MIPQAKVTFVIAGRLFGTVHITLLAEGIFLMRLSRPSTKMNLHQCSHVAHRERCLRSESFGL